MFPAPPCDQCKAFCCKQTSHSVSVVLEQEELHLFPEAIPWDESEDGEMGLPYIDGKCIHLGDDNRCQIYERRPLRCRSYNCLSGHPQYNPERNKLSFFLEDHPEVVELIELSLQKLTSE